MHAQLESELAFWRKHRDQLVAAGGRIWTREDFKPGDLVQVKKHSWGVVVKANPKKLRVQHEHAPWPLDYDYSWVTGKN